MSEVLALPEAIEEKMTKVEKADLEKLMAGMTRRVMKERGDSYVAARPRWESQSIDPVVLLSHLAELLSRSKLDGVVERHAVQMIRLIASYGGKADLLKLLSLTEQVENQQVLLSTLDCALAIGGQSAVYYLIDAVERYSKLPDDTLFRVATYAYDRLLCKGYDLMSGPRADETVSKSLERRESTVSRSDLFAVSNEDDTMAALQACNAEAAENVRLLLQSR